MTSSDAPSLIVIGTGGHAHVLLSTIRRLNAKIAGFLDDDPAKAGQTYAELPVLGSEILPDRFPPTDFQLVNGVGSTKRPEKRMAVFQRFRELGYRFASVIDPNAVIADDVKFGEGVQVMAGAVIQPGCRLGDNVIVNTRASVDHDCDIGDHSHIACGAVLCGDAVIGQANHIGAGAVIIQSIRTGDECVVGAGAVVIREMPAGALAYGVPAKQMNK